MRAHDKARETEAARLAMRRKSYDPAASSTASTLSTESSGRETLFPLMPPCYSARPQQTVVSPRAVTPRQFALEKSPLATLPMPPPQSRPGTNNSPRPHTQQQPRASTALPGMRPNGQASPASAWMSQAWMNAPASPATAPQPRKFDTSYPVGEARTSPPPPPPYGGMPYVDEQLRKLKQKNRELASEVREVNDLLHFERGAHHSAHGQWATNREQGLQQAAAARQRQRRLRRGMRALAAAGAANRRSALLVHTAAARLRQPRVTVYFTHWRRTVARGAARKAESRQQEKHASAEQARAPSRRRVVRSVVAARATQRATPHSRSVATPRPRHPPTRPTSTSPLVA